MKQNRINLFLLIVQERGYMEMLEAADDYAPSVTVAITHVGECCQKAPRENSKL